MPSQDGKRMANPLCIPIEVVELIIDNAPDGPTFIACSLVCKEWLARCRYYLFRRIRVAAGSCEDVLPYLSGPSKAGHFVQSLVIKETSPDLLGATASTAANNLMRAVPNVRELQMIGGTEWALEHFLDPLVDQIEDITMSSVRASSWFSVRNRIAKCSPKLRCLRISSLHLPAGKSTASKSALMGTYFELPHLERLAIESEAPNSAFANELLEDITSSTSTTRIHTVELPLPLPLYSFAFLTAVGSTLTHLILHCDHPGSVSASKHLNLNLDPCKRLSSLHVVGIHAYSSAARSVFDALAFVLKRFPYNTIREVHIASRALRMHGYTTITSEDWEALDEALSAPPMAFLERVEMFGFVGASRMGKLLPQTHARGIIRILGY